MGLGSGDGREPASSGSHPAPQPGSVRAARTDTEPVAQQDLGEHASLRLPEPPDSALAHEAEECVRELSSPALYGHCARTWAFAAPFSQRDRVKHDGELLYLACMLHDLGLTEKHWGHDTHARCFAVEGARAAHTLVQASGVSEERARKVAGDCSAPQCERAGPPWCRGTSTEQGRLTRRRRQTPTSNRSTDHDGSQQALAARRVRLRARCVHHQASPDAPRVALCPAAQARLCRAHTREPVRAPSRVSAATSG